MEIEPVSIAHKLGGWHRFLFEGKSELLLLDAQQFVEQWSARLGKSVMKQKHRDFTRDGMFEVRVWLQ